MKPPQPMLTTWGFANMETSAGLLSRIETLITQDLLQKRGGSPTESFPRKRENDAVARFGALRSTARLPALPPCEARCGGFLVVFVYLQAPLAVICVANEWASCTMSCINAAFGRTAGRARATTRGNETNAAVKRNRCGGRNAEHSRL